MKKCFVMFVFLVVMLLIASLTGTDVNISKNSVVEYMDAEPLLISDNSGNINRAE